MKFINNEKLLLACSDVWIAKAYSEYMADAAAIQADLIAGMTEAASDEALDTLLDTKLDAIDTDFQEIEQLVLNSFTDQGVFPNQEQMNWGATQFDARFDELYLNDTSFKTKVDTFRTNYGYTGIDLSDFTGYFAQHNTNDIVAKDPEVINTINGMVTSVCSELGIDPNTDYTLNEGFTPIKNIISTYIFQTNLSLSDPRVMIQITDGLEHSAGFLNTTAEDIMEQIKTNFASATAWAQGFAATAMGNAQEALSYFEAQIKNIISDVQEKFATTVAQVRALIASTRADVTSFISTASEWLGWNKVADEAFTTVDETDIMAYTGASPLSGVNLKTASGILQATGKTLLAAGQAIWEGLKWIGGKLWNKAKPVVMAVTDNPVDIAVIDNTDLSYTVQGWRFSVHDNPIDIVMNKINPELSYDDMYNTAREALLSKVGQWVCIDTYFGILEWRIRAIEKYDRYIQADDRTDHCIRLYCDLEFKPKCISWSKALEFGVVYIQEAEDVYSRQVIVRSAITNYDKYKDFIASGDIYANDDDDEADKFMGLLIAPMLLNNIFSACYSDNSSLMSAALGWNMASCWVSSGFCNIYGTQSGQWSDIMIYNYDPLVDHFHVNWNGNRPSNVTNLNFIQAICGYNKDNYNWETFRQVPYSPDYGSTAVYAASISTVLSPMLVMFVMQQIERKANPLDYTFLPYCAGSYDFPEGRYKIKTDAENMNVANVIATAIAVIIVVVASILICKSILKVFKIKRMSKLNSKIGIMDNAVWNGKKMSFIETVKYNRWKNKYEKLSGASSGLAGGTSLMSRAFSSIFGIAKTQASAINWPQTIATGHLQTQEYSNISDTKGTAQATLSQVQAEIAEIRRILASLGIPYNQNR